MHPNESTGSSLSEDASSSDSFREDSLPPVQAIVLKVYTYRIKWIQDTTVLTPSSSSPPDPGERTLLSAIAPLISMFPLHAEIELRLYINQTLTFCLLCKFTSVVSCFCSFIDPHSILKSVSDHPR